jgi:hypothetical protein
MLSAHEQTPLPLAMFNSDCFCRLWACNALDAMGRDYRMAYNSTACRRSWRWSAPVWRSPRNWKA